MQDHRQTDRQTDSPNQYNILGATIFESDLILDKGQQLSNSYKFTPQLDGLSFDKAFLDELEIGSNGPVHILASARNALFGIPGLDYFPPIKLSSQGNGIWEFYSDGVNNTSLGLSNAPISFSWKEDKPLEASLERHLIQQKILPKVDDIGNGGTIILNVVIKNATRTRYEWKDPAFISFLDKTMDLVNQHYKEMNVNLKAEYVITEEIMTKEEFISRPEYTTNDSFMMMMYLSPDEDPYTGNWYGSSEYMQAGMESAGWNDFSDWTGREVGLAATEDFEAVIDFNKVGFFRDRAGFNYAHEALAYIIEHESGHPKFRFHPGNQGNAGQTVSRATPGHIPETIMQPGSNRSTAKNWTYDIYMRELLQILHGQCHYSEDEFDEKMILFDMNDESYQTDGTLKEFIYKDIKEIKNSQTIGN
ncbi:hypothetical protein SapgrDRAFT_1568 [Saprospira grandis DSM 2844]|uniref:Uncharacterized protein n=1 Tax=Saprospira grandis DSM 2844 TaxID=694433 RepID=J0P0H4_9BACT|nr:hypothetical protein [Saprospira grandis]EJF53279.1 hypothetical protein SapgrDRAFT_1568 [Saprospira grandis DSM 2844]